MKYLVLFLVLLLVFCEANTKRSDLPVALENVTRHLFNLETQMFINNYGVESSTLTWLLLKSLNENAMPFRLQNLELEEDKVLLDSSAFLTFNSFKKVRTFNEKLELTNEFYKPLQLYVYCQGATIRDLESLAVDVHLKASKVYIIHSYKEAVLSEKYNHLQKSSVFRLKTEPMDVIQYEYYVIEEDLSVKLLTFVWYSPGKCGKLHLIEVNKFIKKRGIWENNKFSKEKLKRFYGCKIVFTQENFEPGSKFALIIPQLLEGHLNYKLSLFKHDGQAVDVIHRKACYDSQKDYERLGSFESFLKGEELNSAAKSQFFITHAVGFSPSWLAVPPSEKYSEYEKLKMPFDDYVWALITLTFVTAFVTIFILYRLSQTTRHFVIGSNVTTPSLNVTQIFFGIAQVVLPPRNFARFLTMSFILYSLIIRTAWQGKMYEFMQKDVMKPELQTIEEMIEQGYTFYMGKYYKEKYPESQISLRGKIADLVLPNNFTRDYELQLLSNILNPKFKGVMQVESVARTWFTNQSEGRFAARPRTAVLHISMCGLEFPRHHHFTGIFDLKSQQLFNGGIIPHFKNNGTNVFNLLDPMKEVEERFKHLYVDGPKVLNLIMLEPGFVIWLSSLSFAITTFLLELLATLRTFLVMKHVLLALYRTKDDTMKSTFKECISVVVTVDLEK